MLTGFLIGISIDHIPGNMLHKVCIIRLVRNHFGSSSSFCSRCSHFGSTLAEQLAEWEQKKAKLLEAQAQQENAGEATNAKTNLPPALLDPAIHRKVGDVPGQMMPGTGTLTSLASAPSVAEPWLKRLRTSPRPRSEALPASETAKTTASGFTALIDTPGGVEEGGAAWHMMLKRGEINSFKQLLDVLRAENESDELAALLKDHVPLISTIEEKINNAVELEATARHLPVWGEALRLHLDHSRWRRRTRRPLPAHYITGTHMVPKCFSPLPEVFVRGYPRTQYLVNRQDS